MSGGDHGDQSDPLPADDEDSPLTTPLEFATLQLLRILAKSLEDSGGSKHQPKGTTDVNAFVIQFLGQGHRVIVIIHKQVVSLVTETIHKTEDSVTQRTEDPGVDGEVDDVTSVELRHKEELYTILLWLLGVVDFDAELAFVRHHPLIQRQVLRWHNKGLASVTDVLQHWPYDNEAIRITPGYGPPVEEVEIPVQRQVGVTSHQGSNVRHGHKKTTPPIPPDVGGMEQAKKYLEPQIVCNVSQVAPTPTVGERLLQLNKAVPGIVTGFCNQVLEQLPG